MIFCNTSSLDHNLIKKSFFSYRDVKHVLDMLHLHDKTRFDCAHGLLSPLGLHNHLFYIGNDSSAALKICYILMAGQLTSVVLMFEFLKGILISSKNLSLAASSVKKTIVWSVKTERPSQDLKVEQPTPCISTRCYCCHLNGF